jgi:hypothetical protein
VTKDDRFYLNRVALFAHAQQVGVTRACADFQVHRATYYCEDSRRSPEAV